MCKKKDKERLLVKILINIISINLVCSIYLIILYSCYCLDFVSYLCFISFCRSLFFFFFSSRRRHTRSYGDWEFRRVLFRSPRGGRATGRSPAGGTGPGRRGTAARA